MEVDVMMKIWHWGLVKNLLDRVYISKLMLFFL